MGMIEFSRCAAAHLNTVPQKDGQIIYVTDTHELYLDAENTRHKISTSADKTSFNASGTELEATNAEAAIKEVDAKIGDISEVLDRINGETIIPDAEEVMDVFNDILDTQDEYEGYGGTAEEIEAVLDEVLGNNEEEE